MQSSDAHIGDNKPTQLDQRQIMQATRSVLRELGYEKTTIRKIAARLDCAVGSIYRYFKDKNCLLFEVAQQALVPVVESLDAGERFEPSVDRYLRVAAQEGESYRLMFWLAAVLAPEDKAAALPPIVTQVIEGWAQRLGSRQLAERAWASVQGAIDLGASPDAVLDDLALSMPTWRTAYAGSSDVVATPKLKLAGEPVAADDDAAADETAPAEPIASLDDAADTADDSEAAPPDLNYVSKIKAPAPMPSMKLRDGVTPPAAKPAEAIDTPREAGIPQGEPSQQAASDDRPTGDDVTLL